MTYHLNHQPLLSGNRNGHFIIFGKLGSLFQLFLLESKSFNFDAGIDGNKICHNSLNIGHMKKISLFVIGLLCIFSNVVAQDNLANYKRAQTLLGYGNYSEAMGLLEPYMDEKAFGNLSRYATFNYALAAYQSGQYELAQNSILTIKDKRGWSTNDDARYILALTYFQDNKFEEALKEVAQIKDPKVKEQAENASFNFLKNASLSFLVNNLKSFRDNKGYTLALRDKLESEKVMSADHMALYNDIVDKDAEKRSKNPKSLDVAVILPFNYTGGSGVKSLKANNFVFELYQGIQHAVKELQDQGLSVNLKTFDSERDTEKLQKILSDSFMMQADVIIGPIYPEESEIVMSFAERSSIPFINPLSNVDDKISGMKHAYLFRPSVESLADGIMDYARKNITGKNLSIAYSSATRDEMLAQTLAEKAKDFGYTIVENKKVSAKEIINFMDNIKGKNNDNFAVLLVDDPNIAAPALGYMESQSIQMPIMVMDSWLYFNFANFEMLESQNLHFIGNNSLDLEDKKLTKFREDFNEQFVAYPSFNASQGYDLMHWIANTINPKDGFDFRKNLDKKGMQNGQISYGWDFTNSNSNKNVPITRINGGVKVENK